MKYWAVMLLVETEDEMENNDLRNCIHTNLCSNCVQTVEVASIDFIKGSDD